jgi:hypothetical protein
MLTWVEAGKFFIIGFAVIASIPLFISLYQKIRLAIDNYKEKRR